MIKNVRISVGGDKLNYYETGQELMQDGKKTGVLANRIEISVSKKHAKIFFSNGENINFVGHPFSWVEGK
jgi:hypothetical protein